jgi:hypothetical protein
MKSQPYYFEIKDQLKMFVSALDGAIINRYDETTRVSKEQIAVRYLYSSKQRAINDLTNKAQAIELPVVAFIISGIQRDRNRVFNKLDGSDTILGSQPTHIPQPLPINININVSILTRFQTDMDQIISNMFAYTDPYIAISWERMGLAGAEIRNKVLWNGGLNLTYPVDITDNQQTRVELDTSFTIEGWIFKQDGGPSGLIQDIFASFSALSSIENNITWLDSQATPANTEMFTISGQPEIVTAFPYFVNHGTQYNLNVYGSFIRGISSAYLSGDNNSYPSLSNVLVDQFSTFPTLSAEFPAFNGFQIPFAINSENAIVISIPPPLSAGFFDIIFVNNVGYSQLTNSTSAIEVF